MRRLSAIASTSTLSVAVLIRLQYIVGTPAKNVTFSSPINDSAVFGSNLGSSTRVAPVPKPAFICTVWPKEWNSGSVTRWTSWSTTPNSRWQVSALSTMLACDSSAPFGSPVVPLV